MAKKVTDYNILINRNIECEAKLVVVMQTDKDHTVTAELSEATFKHIHKANAALLKAFIHVRESATVKPKKPFKWPNKLKPADAERGTPCLVFRAHKCRSDHVVLMMPTESQRVQPTSRHIGAPVIEFGGFQSNTFVLASVQLRNESWRKLTIEAYRLDAENAITNLDQATLDRADHLQQLLVNRLHTHVNEKVPEKLRKHWEASKALVLLFSTEQVGGLVGQNDVVWSCER